MMQGVGMAPTPMAPLPMNQQQQMLPPPQPVPPQWGVVPPPAPQPQYPPAQPTIWNQLPSQIPPPQAVPQPQQFQLQYGAPMAATASVPIQTVHHRPSSTDEVRTLWIGDLQYWMEESYIHSCFAHTGEVVSIKLIRNKQTGQLEGYGFIEFASRSTAEGVLQTYNGTMMPNGEQAFRLNWASAGGKKGDDANDFSIFVGDLASDVTDYVLQETFRSHYPSVRGAKIVNDKITGRSKGYGFVKFGDANEQTRAMTEMNGMFCSTRPMRIGPAANKKLSDVPQQDISKGSVDSEPARDGIGAKMLRVPLDIGPGITSAEMRIFFNAWPRLASYQNSQGDQAESGPNNSTIFVGGLDPNVTEDLMQKVFSPYGELVHVKIPVGKRCGFVQFVNRACAEEALLMLQGTQLGAQKIRLSWGRSPSSKQTQQDPNQWTGNYYGYGQSYEAYGYTQAPQDPNMYAYGNYPGFANYQQQQ